VRPCCQDIHTALVGNWVEERALEADTGVFRYKGWVPDGGEPGAGGSVYAEKVGAPEATATFNRVIVHTNRLVSETPVCTRSFVPPTFLFYAHGSARDPPRPKALGSLLDAQR